MLLGFFAPGPVELVIIGAVAFLLFGSQLPRVARSIGQSLPQFKRGMKEIELEIAEMDNKIEDATKKM